ncbi:MAG: hypothetical protein JSW39_25215 [Desulfobacterales bacterium]|nr:MAG: hypothetical protein JSW39_25215 [Desulfobacterales bacterium]
MKTRFKLVFGLFQVILLAAAVAGLALAKDLALDQNQENTTYGFWFDATVIRWQEFKPRHASLAQIDLHIQKNGRPGNLMVAVRDGSETVLWETTLNEADVPALGWIEIAVAPAIPLNPNSSYFLQVSSDAGSPGPEQRYFWQGQQSSDYVRGISSVEADWPGYDFAFRTWSSASEFGRICYIYDEEREGAERYKALLEANGYETTLVSMSAVAGTDYSPYDLIIVGPDTGEGYEWGEPEAVEAVQDSALPILGLGYHGGTALFQEMGLSMNWGHGMLVTGDSLYVVDPEHPICHSPYAIEVPPSRIVQVLKTSSQHVGEFIGSLSDEAVLLGRAPEYPDHYPLVQEGPHVLWGFPDYPDNLTHTGKALFINLVHHLAPAMPYLYLSLNIEDALEGVPVNKIVGDTEGPTYWTRLEIVTKLISLSSSAKDDIPVDLAIPGDLFGSPMHTWVRNSAGGSLTEVAYTDLGGGRYRVTTDLAPVVLFPGITLYYRKEIVWRFLIPNDTAAQDVVVTAEINVAGKDPVGSGTVRILALGSVHSLIIANRQLLYEKYNDSSVTALLQRLFTEAQGPPASHTPRGVIYYVERYDGRAGDWDQTAVDYTSEATANVVANAIDDLVEDWWEDALEWRSTYIPGIGNFLLPFAWPTYLLIVGDDDTIPFYRYDDPSNDEGINYIGGCPSGWCVDSATNPAVHATDEDYFLTDNPYADLGGGTDWQTGDIEMWVGRLLRESAADMLALLEEGVDWNNGRTGGVVMASVDGWELGLEPDDGRAGEIADLHDVPALLRGRGFAVRNDDVPTAEVRTIDVMPAYEGGNTSWNNNFRNAANNAGGMDLFLIGGHDSYDHAVIPGDDFSPDDTPILYTRFDDDHPIAMIVGCHGGLPVPDVDVAGGADHSMVYDLIREGARAYIGATGFSYGSPNNLHRCTWGERLIQRFFNNLMAPVGTNSMTIGKAMAAAKRDYVFGFGTNDALDRKTVTEFNLYGVPWSFLFYPVPATGSAQIDVPSQAPAGIKGFAILARPIQRAAEAATYTQTFEVTIDAYDVKKEVQNDVTYDLFSIKGGETAVAPGAPILPYVKGYTLPLPYDAQIVAVEVVRAQSEPIGTYNIPIARVMPWSEGGLVYTTATQIEYPYPVDRDLVQYQQSGNQLLFTLFPIQHNPTSDETRFYNYFAVNVTYEAPLTVAVSEFTTDKSQYIPGEPIHTTTRIDNIGESEALLRALLEIKDAVGESVGAQTSDEFVVPSGGSYLLPLSWSGMLADGAYTAEITVLSGANAVGGASQSITVVSGEIIDFIGPETLLAGQTGVFDVWFANYTSQALAGEVRLSIQAGEGGFVQELPPKPIEVAATADAMVSFKWTPVGVSEGPYSAMVNAVVNGQNYGPVSRSFMVILSACPGDLNKDGDVDGADLALYISAPTDVPLADLAGDFGGNDCRDTAGRY